jgi:hypothetical protein
MTDRELVFALFGLLGSRTNSVLLSLQLLNKEVPIATIVSCKKEMDLLVRNLAALSEPQAKAFIKEILDEIRDELRSRNKND